MPKIRRGPTSYKRRNAKNYTHREAQARLNETVEPFNRQVENSLFVNSVEIDYYQSQVIGKPCTCEKIEVRPEYNTITADGPDETNVEPVIPTVDDDSSAGIGIELQDDNLFGDGPAEKLYGASVVDVSDNDSFPDDDIPEEVYREVTTKEGDSQFAETTMFGSNANCGICYRLGYQPGYVSYGKQRYVLTTWDIECIGSYTINTANTPNTMLRQGPVANHTFVEFMISVPKYFRSCVFSVRNNTQILTSEKLYVEGHPMSLQTLRHYAGREMKLKTTAQGFTHVVIEFDLGLDKVRANLGPESQTLDYQRLEALANFPVVLPPSIHAVNTGDVIVIRDRKLVLKVQDMERKITSDKRQLEWVVQTRVVQRTEPLRDIAKGIKVL